MAELREIYLPEHLEEMDEIVEIDWASEKKSRQLEYEVEALEDDILIELASEKGIARREKILGIRPKDGKMLSQRRAKVLAEWYDVYPYSRLSLNRKLTLMCGEGHAWTSVNVTNQTMDVYLDLHAKDVREEVAEMLERIVPLMVIIHIEVVYNKWRDYLPMKWNNSRIRGRTWGMMKEGII